MEFKQDTKNPQTDKTARERTSAGSISSESVSVKERKALEEFLRLVPIRLCIWKVEDGDVIVFKRRFRWSFTNYFAEQLGFNTRVRVRLDKVSSTIWKLMDGRKSVASIAEELVKNFGKDIEPLYPRLREFFVMLEYNEMGRLVRKE
ncbi:MAG: PqqD family protein [Thermoplasmata archaeon]